MIEEVLGTAGVILAPFLELLQNETIIGIIVLIAALTKFGTWLDQKVILDKFKSGVELKKKMIDIEKDVMSGKSRLDYDKIRDFLNERFNLGDPTTKVLDILGEELDKEKWK